MSTSSRLLQRLPRAALILVITLLFSGLVSAVLALPPLATGLADEVIAGLEDTGVRNPVTATLLNFRSYDTLMEIAVLLLAVTAIQAMQKGKTQRLSPADPILSFLTHVLVPVMILIAGYLLMAGTDAPGGAFQAGAILAAAGILVLLTDAGMPLRGDGLPMRLCLVAGLAGFLAIGLAGILVYGAFLGYPRRLAVSTVLLLEIGASVSVAVALLKMFIAVLRGRNPADTTASNTREDR